MNAARISALLAAAWLAAPRAAADDFGSAPPFKHGDTVCFVGDSITHGGTYHSIITLFYATRFPGRAIRSFNCGIGGDRASAIMSDEKFRLNTDILGRKPTVATIMLGMNDIGHADYRGGASGPQAEQRRQASLASYEENMQKLIGSLQKAGAHVILITPSIYDETTRLGNATTNLTSGGNAALGKCDEMVRAWSGKYGTGIVNFFETMNAINAREQTKDPAFTLVGPDRVHPGPVGHFVMAYAFLKAQGLPREVAAIGVDARKAEASGAANCEISNVKANAEGIEFDCAERALPLVVPDEARPALALVPFMRELNAETLVVGGLAPGNYDLKIDSQPAGEYTAAQLSAGVNLAENPATPQYQQSAAATKLNAELTRIGAQLRGLASQYYSLSRAKLDVNDPAAVERALRARLAATAKNGKTVDSRVKAAFDAFQNRERLEQECDALAIALREACRPRPHRFVLAKKGQAR